MHLFCQNLPGGGNVSLLTTEKINVVPIADGCYGNYVFISFIIVSVCIISSFLFYYFSLYF